MFQVLSLVIHVAKLQCEIS